MMNALDFALKMEQDGEVYYREQAELTKNEQMKQVFLAFAEDEQRHYQAILSMKNSTKYNHEGNDFSDQVRTIFSGGFRTEDQQTNQGLVDAYKLAIGFEQKSITLYADLASQATDANEKVLLQKLVKEEENHYAILWKLSELLQRPEEWYPYLEW